MRCGEYVPFGGLPGVGEPPIHRSNKSRRTEGCVSGRRCEAGRLSFWYLRETHHSCNRPHELKVRHLTCQLRLMPDQLLTSQG